MIEITFRNIPKMLMLTLQLSIQHDKQFRVICLQSITCLIAPVAIWYGLVFLQWLPHFINGLFGMDELPPMEIAMSLIDVSASFMRWLAIWAFVWAAFVYVMFMIVVSTLRWKKRKNSLFSVIQMYGEAILIFSVAYFFLSFFNTQDLNHIGGFQYLGESPTYWLSDLGGYFTNIFNAIYFSVCTMVHYSSGEYIANSMPAKSITMLQLLYATLITLIFIGRIFSDGLHRIREHKR